MLATRAFGRCHQVQGDIAAGLLDQPSHSHQRDNGMPSKAQRITGWILTGLVGLFLIAASGIPKFFDFPGKNEMSEW